MGISGTVFQFPVQLSVLDVYGIGGMQATNMQWMLMMFRAPNQWREVGGKLTRDWETPEYQEAVATLRGFWDSGYVHPDTPTYVQQSGAQPFYAGKFGLYPTNFFAFGIAWLVLVAAEMIAVDSGLGYLIIDARNAGKRYDLVVAGMLLIGVIGLLLDSGIRMVEKLPAVKWAFHKG